MPYDNLDQIDPIEATEPVIELDDPILESLNFEDARTDVEKRKDKKYEYREITYNKQDVTDVEKKAIGEMVKIEPADPARLKAMYTYSAFLPYQSGQSLLYESTGI